MRRNDGRKQSLSPTYWGKCDGGALSPGGAVGVETTGPREKLDVSVPLDVQAAVQRGKKRVGVH